uniref:Zinc transporter ZIP10 isoform X2 n=1 Tax=Geotrypetes seraphini TaxID=260995 RepID=A0A6P8RFZ5_GEOSA|nr:zinc transporter ZIP10 isoform X2 [Geotrypetes seraphini]
MTAGRECKFAGRSARLKSAGENTEYDMCQRGLKLSKIKKMKVHMHTKFCIICLLTFIFHQCNHCHKDGHDHGHDDSHVHNHSDYQISEEPYHQNGGVDSGASKESVPEAEHEQRYYIEKLFDRYGENGRLSFYGLEKLLANLGLGEVKVVEINHEDIGHDHVSHLEALEVQEGKHTHWHSHIHSHSHSSSENQTMSSDSAKRNKKCDLLRGETTESSVKSDNKHSHDHNHHLNRHHHDPRHYREHNSTHHSHNDSISHTQHREQSQEHLTNTSTSQEQPEGMSQKHRKKRKRNKSRETPMETTPESGSDSDHGEQHEHNHVHKHERVNLSLIRPHLHEYGNDLSATPGQQDHNPDEGNGHRHAQKREAPNNQISVRKQGVFSFHSHQDHGEEDHQHDECLNVTQLLQYYGLGVNSPISPDQFTYLCPALLYQIDSRLCVKHSSQLHVEDLDKHKASASAWVCGLISITVISLLSLLGIILIPIINQGCFRFLLSFLVALAVGTLSGDALLHLLPHSQGGHDHSQHSGHSHKPSHRHGAESESLLEEYDSVMKGLVALAGIYLLFILEHCIRMFKHYKDEKGKQKWFKKKQVEESVVGRKLSDHKLNRRSDAEWLQLKPLSGADDSVFSDERLNETELTDAEIQQESLSKTFISIEEEKMMQPSLRDESHVYHDLDFHDGGYNSHDKTVPPKKQRHHKHSHHSHGHCHSGKDMKDTGISSIAWMVIMGDGMHNFSDGLAIGAAFSAGLTGGISTSVAVFCHELPHELGDFAVLLTAGMTVKQAIVYNLLSAMMAYVGMLIGTAVGQYATNVTLWIFAITAGMFLYVALVDMLPEMLHGDGGNEEYGYCPMGQFILQNLGLLLGFAIMLVIALYEDKIVFDIQF